MIPMFTAISVNAVHVLCSLWFAFGMDMGIVGIAYASVIAQWTGVALSAPVSYTHLLMRRGGEGVISVAANVFPKRFMQCVGHAKQGDFCLLYTSRCV